MTSLLDSQQVFLLSLSSVCVVPDEKSVSGLSRGVGIFLFFLTMKLSLTSFGWRPDASNIGRILGEVFTGFSLSLYRGGIKIAPSSDCVKEKKRMGFFIEDSSARGQLRGSISERVLLILECAV